MRRFAAEYLRDTRRGMWEDRDALAPLDLPGRERILDVGAGTGEFARVLDAESDAEVVSLDADRRLLTRAPGECVAGDAARLPFSDGSFDLVACQALLINLPDPDAAIEEFARVSSDIVAVVEPDNAAVAVDSTVSEEPALARRARRAYIEGVGTDVTLGPAADRFRAAGLSDVSVRLHRHRRQVEPPYSEVAVEAATRKATGGRLDDQRPVLLAGNLTPAEYDDLRDDWREMGRAVAEQMREGAYEREEVVPFYVTAGRV